MTASPNLSHQLYAIRGAADATTKDYLTVRWRAMLARGAEILIREGARLMAKDAKGKTPLDYAESASMIGLLKKHGATER